VVIKGSDRMTVKNGNFLTAQEISKKFKLAYPTINHYTDLGFLSIIKREGNKRLYDGRQVKRRLDQIAKLANEGYPLRLIRKKIMSNGKGGHV
jgi:DNA-binding transcriptional MerR regulator